MCTVFPLNSKNTDECQTTDNKQKMGNLVQNGCKNASLILILTNYLNIKISDWRKTFVGHNFLSQYHTIMSTSMYEREKNTNKQKWKKLSFCLSKYCPLPVSLHEINFEDYYHIITNLDIHWEEPKKNRKSLILI